MPSSDPVSLAILATALGAEQHWQLRHDKSDWYHLVLTRNEMGFHDINRDVYFHGGQVTVSAGHLELTVATDASPHEAMSDLLKRSIQNGLVALTKEATTAVARWAAMSVAYSGD